MCRLLTFSILLIFASAYTSYAQCPSLGYAYEKIITITAATGADLNDFPVLIKIPADAFPPTHLKTTQGYDVIFTELDYTKLDHQIDQEFTGVANDTLVVWVKIPAYSHSTSTEIRMLYGKTGATDPSTTNVWDADYKSVWHFSSNIDDATSNGQNLTDHGTADLSSSVIGNGRDLNNWVNTRSDVVPDTGKYLRLNNGYFSTITNFSFEGWVYLDRYNTEWERIFDFGKRDTLSFYLTPSNNANSPAETWCKIRNSATIEQGFPIANVDPIIGEWTHWVVVLNSDSKTLSVYKNGTLFGSGGGITLNPSNLETISSNYFGKSHWGANHLIDAKFDEFRISSTTRSADWIATEYANQRSPKTFCQIDATERPASGKFYSIKSGNWSSDSVWSCQPNGGPCGLFPEAGDTTFIQNGNVITLIANAEVRVLNIDNGNITTGANTLMITEDDSAAITRTSGHVIGNLERNANTTGTTYLYPVGTATSYNPLSITFSNIIPGSLRVSYIAGDIGSAGLPLNDNEDSIYTQCTTGYWQTQAFNSLASSNYSITLNTSGFGDVDASSRIIKKEGGDFFLDGTHGSLAGSVISRNNFTGGISISNTTFAIGKGKPRITAQPQPKGVCDGGTAKFSVAATGHGTLTYQWQEYQGSGWNDISDVGVYIGASNDTLTISGASLSMNNYQYKCIVTDGGGNSTESNGVKLTVGDTIKPTLTAVSNRFEYVNASCEFSIPNYKPLSTVNDNCPVDLVVSQRPIAGTHFSGHNNDTIVWIIADDGHGNKDSVSFNVTLKDTIKPTLTAVANRNEYVNASCEFSIPNYTGLSTSNDNCPADLVVSQRPVVGTVISGHNNDTIVWIIVNDGHGNKDSVSFTVTLKDTIKPTLTAVSNRFEYVNASCEFSIPNYKPLSTVNDNCPADLVVSQKPDVGTVISGHNNDTIVWIIADDGHGNKDSVSFTVTLKDTIKPTLTPVANRYEYVNASCEFSIPNYKPLSTVNDNCPADLVVSQKPDVGTVISGHNNDTIVWIIADDGHGNKDSVSFTVTLKDIIKPTLTPVANRYEYVNASCEFSIPNYKPLSTVNDNCPVDLVVSQKPIAGTPFSGHNNDTIVWIIADDGHDNKDSVSFTVTLKDTIKPTFTVPIDITICRSSDCSFNANPSVTGDVTDESDNCSTNINATYSDDNLNLPSCSNYGYIIRTWSLKDIANNTTIKTQIIWIEPAVDVTIADDTICNSTTVLINPQTTDVARYGIRYTWTANDASGRITGYSSSTGNGYAIGKPIQQTLINNDLVAHEITYSITPYAIFADSSLHCSGTISSIKVWVEPTPTMNVTIADTLYCSNSLQTFRINASTTVGTMLYDLTPYLSGMPGDITGFPNGTKAIADFTDTLKNNSVDFQTVAYQFTPKIRSMGGAGYCGGGRDTTITIYVNPVPRVNVSVDNSRDSICFREGTTLKITSPNRNVIGKVKYNLTVSNPGSVEGVASNGTYNIDSLSQALVNNSDNQIQTVTYTLTPFIDSIRGSATCSNGISDTIAITVVPDITFNLVADTFIGGDNIRCKGELNGSVKISSLQGGLQSQGYSYKWDNKVETTDSIYNLGVGTYNVTVTDKLGCIGSNSISLSEPNILKTVVVSYSATKCEGGNTGYIHITTQGGNSSYTYSWKGPDNYTSVSKDIDNLYSGRYKLTVTDINNCVDSLTQAIEFTSPPGINWQEEFHGTFPNWYHISCYGKADGVLRPTIDPDRSYYQYRWSGPDGFTANIKNIDNLKAGDYRLTVTDNVIGCDYKYGPVRLTQPDLITYSAYPTNIVCHGDSTGLIRINNVEGGYGEGTYQYEWQTTDGSGINQGNPMQLSLTAGAYILKLKSNNTLCSITDTFTLTEPPQLMVNAFIPDAYGYEVPCHGSQSGSIGLTVNGGFGGRTYNWSTPDGIGLVQGDSVQRNLSAGTYMLTVTYGGVCPETYTYVLREPDPMALDSTLQHITCFGGSDGSIGLTNVRGGLGSYSYQWSSLNEQGLNPTQRDQSNLSAGNYTVEVTDRANCKYTKTYTLTQPDSFRFVFTSTPISCNSGANGSITVSIEGGTKDYTYLWSNGKSAITINGLAMGVYTVTVTDSRQCKGNSSFTLTSPSPLVVIPTISSNYNRSNISCFGATDGIVSLNVTGGREPYTFQWSNGSTSQNLINVGADTFNVVVNDRGGCQGTASAILTQPAALSFNYTKQDVLCYGYATGNITLDVQGGTTPYTYVWSGGQTTPVLNGVKAGHYNFIIADANNCHLTSSAEITQPDSIAGNPEIIKPYCPDALDGEIRLVVNGGVGPYQILWSNDNRTTSLDHVRPGSYVYRITDMNNCVVRDTIMLVPANPFCLDIPSAFSPNNDGANDTWVILAGDPKSPIEVINMYPHGVFEVYTRWGTQVFQSGPGYPYPWDGTYMGRPLPLDSYYYIFDPKDGGKIVKGIVTIVR